MSGGGNDPDTYDDVRQQRHAKASERTTKTRAITSSYELDVGTTEGKERSAAQGPSNLQQLAGSMVESSGHGERQRRAVLEAHPCEWGSSRRVREMARRSWACGLLSEARGLVRTGPAVEVRSFCHLGTPSLVATNVGQQGSRLGRRDKQQIDPPREDGGRAWNACRELEATNSADKAVRAASVVSSQQVVCSIVASVLRLSRIPAWTSELPSGRTSRDGSSPLLTTTGRPSTSYANLEHATNAHFATQKPRGNGDQGQTKRVLCVDV